jgi:hypothetical protein
VAFSRDDQHASLNSRVQDVFQALAEQVRHVFVIERVKGHLAVPAPPDQAELSQQAQLVRDGRLAHLERCGQVANAQLTDSEGRENPHACRVAERSEELCQARCARSIQQLLLSALHLIRMHHLNITSVSIAARHWSPLSKNMSI